MLKRFLGVLLGACLFGSGAMAQTLPPEIEASKTVKVALNAGYAPMEMRDVKTGELVGFDIDLMKAMADLLGVKVEYLDGSFEAMTPALQSGRVDMIMSGFYDTPKRRPMFEFIDYLKAGAQFFTLESAAEIQTVEDLCGQTIATIRGTSYPETVKAWSDANCVAKGKEPIEVMGEGDVSHLLVNLKTGRAVAGVQGLESVPSIVEMEPGTYRALGEPISFALMGMAFRPDSTVLRDAFVFALKKVIADGTYDELIKKWKLDLSSYKEVTLNAGPQP